MLKLRSGADIWQTSAWSDVDIVFCQGAVQKLLRLHRVILAANSAFFERLLTTSVGLHNSANDRAIYRVEVADLAAAVRVVESMYHDLDDASSMSHRQLFADIKCRDYFLMDYNFSPDIRQIKAEDFDMLVEVLMLPSMASHLNDHEVCQTIARNIPTDYDYSTKLPECYALYHKADGAITPSLMDSEGNRADKWPVFFHSGWQLTMRDNHFCLQDAESNLRAKIPFCGTRVAFVAPAFSLYQRYMAWVVKIRDDYHICLQDLHNTHQPPRIYPLQYVCEVYRLCFEVEVLKILTCDENRYYIYELRLCDLDRPPEITANHRSMTRLTYWMDFRLEN